MRIFTDVLRKLWPGHWQGNFKMTFWSLSHRQTPCITDNSTAYSTACAAKNNENVKYENDKENIKYENYVMWNGPPDMPRR